MRRIINMMSAAMAAAILGAGMSGVARVSAAVGHTVPVNVLTYHNDGFNDGQNLRETVLTPRDVRPSTFGKLFAVPLDGDEVGQPLFVSALRITAGPHRGLENVVFVATSRDLVYAINADNGSVLWKTSLLTKFHGAGDVVAANDGNTSTGRGQPLEDTPAIDLANKIGRAHV